jgi:hypothetical protein
MLEDATRRGVSMHRVTLVLAALAGAALLVPAALADKPSRQPLPAPPTFTITGSCTFDVQVDILRNKEFITAFSSGKLIITGQLFARLTNLSTGEYIDVNISGPGIEDASTFPSTFNLSGTSLIWFPDVLIVSRGPVTITTDASGNVTWTQTSASSLDVCKALR